MPALIFIVLSFYSACGAFFYDVARKSPRGYQNATGFHLGEDQSPLREDATVALPATL
jgi:hypothetical protein